MQKLSISRTNGNVPRSLAGEDHVSGFVFYSAVLPSGFSANDRIKAISKIETAEELGITDDAATWDIKVLHYHLSCIFAQNPGISLYVGIFAKNATYTELKTVQNYAGGRIRQFGVWDGSTALAAANVIALQSVRNTLEQQDKPAVILYTPKVSSINDLPEDLAGANRNGVSVLIGQDGDGKAVELYKSTSNDIKATVGNVGEALGMLSKASVHHTIAWVEQYPTNMAVAAFGDGTLLRNVDTATLESLDAARYIFPVTYDGLAGVYFNDSHNMDAATSDYAYIENVRTMDKACRGVRTYVLPKLGRPMKVDASTGKLETHVVEHLQTTAGKALEDMEKAGELSGYKVEIDPDQNVLSTSRVEIVIKPVGVGVMRVVSVKIGFAPSV